MIRSFRISRALGGLVCGALLVVGGLASAAHAHNQPIDLAFWGDFSASAAHCQRLISYAAARCGMVTWAARNACLSAQLAGGTCDIATTTDTIEQAHQDAYNMIERQCKNDDFVPLGFQGLALYAQADVDIFCQQLEDAASSLVYGPAQRSGAMSSVDPRTQQCVTATAAAATAMFRKAFDVQKQWLAIFATQPLTPEDKFARLRQARARITRFSNGLQQRVTAQCATADFVAVYNQSLSAVLKLLSSRGDCLAGYTSLQNAVVCPDPICGNGMQESGEQCDDGNVVSGDGCSKSCTSESQ